MSQTQVVRFQPRLKPPSRVEFSSTRPITTVTGLPVGASKALYQSYIARYELSDFDENGPTRYHGYLDDVGQYVIKKTDVAAGTIRFVHGASGYTTAWTGRAALTYGYFDATI